MFIIEISTNSDAMDELRRVAQLDKRHDVSTLRIEKRADGVAIKINNGVWSPTLSTNSRVAEIAMDDGPECGWLAEANDARFGCTLPTGHAGNHNV